MWIPELSVGNAIYMEPIEGMDTVPKNRWKLVRGTTSICEMLSLQGLLSLPRKGWSLYSVREPELLYCLSRHLRKATWSPDEHEIALRRWYASSILRETRTCRESELDGSRRR